MVSTHVASHEHWQRLGGEIIINEYGFQAQFKEGVKKYIPRYISELLGELQNPGERFSLSVQQSSTFQSTCIHLEAP